MEKKINIEIKSEDVFKLVKRKTEYIGSKKTGEDAKIYQKLRTTKYNNDILSDFFKEGCSLTDLTLKDFITPSTTTGDDDTIYKVTLLVSSRYNDLLTNTVKSSLTDFFVSYITGMWLKMCEDDAAEDYITASETCHLNVISKLLDKGKPSLTTPETSNMEEKGHGFSSAQQTTGETNYIKGL